MVQAEPGDKRKYETHSTGKPHKLSQRMRLTQALKNLYLSTTYDIDKSLVNF